MIPAIPMTALADGEMTACRINGEEVLIACVNGQFFAVSNFCSHAGQRLSTGRLDGYELRCPLHRASFDVRSGQVLSGPAAEPLRRYALMVDRGKVLIAL